MHGLTSRFLFPVLWVQGKGKRFDAGGFFILFVQTKHRFQEGR